MEVLAEEFGRQVALPRAGSVREADRFVEQALFAGNLAVETIAPTEGDAVLMVHVGRRCELGHHIGIFCSPGGEPHVLHCMAGVGSCLHSLASMPGRKLKPIGVYKWL